MLSPGRFGRLLSVVRLDDDVYLLGMSDASSFTGNVNNRSGVAGGAARSVVSRAYHKLWETHARCGRSRGVQELLEGAVAVDCGAAPGGWTKFLIERGCQKVYAVDPGDMEKELTADRRVVHMRMSARNALPVIADVENVTGGVGVYVSDMCLHDMGKQIDTLLEAARLGVTAPGAFFVLTLKCVVGHSKDAYDYQVEKAVRRLDGVAVGVETVHLFANRSGERTVTGFLR